MLAGVASMLTFLGLKPKVYADPLLGEFKFWRSRPLFTNNPIIPLNIIFVGREICLHFYDKCNIVSRFIAFYDEELDHNVFANLTDRAIFENWKAFPDNYAESIEIGGVIFELQSITYGG